MTCIEKCGGIEPVSSETVDAEHGQCDEGIASEHALASGRIEDETFWKLYMLSMVQTATKQQYAWNATLIVIEARVLRKKVVGSKTRMSLTIKQKWMWCQCHLA